MSYDDWLKSFSDFCVCRLLQDVTREFVFCHFASFTPQQEIGTVWEKRIFFGEWGPETAGGCGNTVNWKLNGMSKSS